MFVSFVSGLVFGIGSGFFEKSIGAPLRKQFELSDSELSIVSFVGLMLMAAIVVAAIRANSSAFWLVLGGGIGAFAIRGYLFSKAEVAKRRELRDTKDVVEETLKEAREDS